jgi:replicative DNA helicase
MLEQPLPHSIESERAVLGAILLDNRLLAQAQLAPDDFYARAHRDTFAAMHDIAAGEINALTIAEVLRRRGVLEQVGGVSFLSELTHGLPLMKNLTPYIAVLREKSALRSLARFGNDLLTRSLEADSTPRDLLSWADEALSRVAEHRAATSFRDFEAISEDAAQGYARMFRGDELALPTGFVEIDENLTGGGFSFTDLIIIAGKASHGKTSFALDVAMNAAHAGLPAAIASLEMADTSLFMRAHSAESGVERWKMRSGIYEPEFRRLGQTLSAVGSLPLFIADHITTVEDFCRQARDVVKRKGVRLLAVDYLQLLTTNARHGTRNDEVGGIARKLKNLALELQTPVIALSQLSRDHDRNGREPELRDLRDSGEIEQHADTVFMLYGDKPEEGATFREVKVKCGKQREGKLFTSTLVFNGGLLTFRKSADVRAYSPAQEGEMLGTM